MAANPGELALALVGITPIINGDVPRMGIERRREALAIPGKLPKLAAQIVDNDVKRPPMPRPHSYRKLLDHFAKELQPHQIQELLNAFPHDASDMSGAFLMSARAALEHLRKLFPMSVYSTFTGPKNLTPDGESVWRFFSQLEVLDDPLRVFPLIATGAILRSQVLAVREIYPTLAKEIDAALYEAIGKKTASSPGVGNPMAPGFRLPPRAEMGLATWLGRRLLSHQPPAANSGQPSANQPPPGPSKAAGDLATRNQRAIAGT